MFHTDRGHGYIDMAGFALGVEDQLGVFTQVATPRGLKLRIRDRVLREAVSVRRDDERHADIIEAAEKISVRVGKGRQMFDADEDVPTVLVHLIGDR
jgi:hypothetical protein